MLRFHVIFHPVVQRRELALSWKHLKTKLCHPTEFQKHDVLNSFSLGDLAFTDTLRNTAAIDLSAFTRLLQNLTSADGRLSM